MLGRQKGPAWGGGSGHSIKIQTFFDQSQVYRTSLVTSTKKQGLVLALSPGPFKKYLQFFKWVPIFRTDLNWAWERG